MSDWKIKEESRVYSITEESFIRNPNSNSKILKDKLSDSKHIYKTGLARQSKPETPRKLKKTIKKQVSSGYKKRASPKFSMIDQDSRNLEFLNILNKIPKAQIQENFLKRKLKTSEDLKMIQSTFQPIPYHWGIKRNSSISIFERSDFSESKSFFKFEKKERSLKECSEAFDNIFQRVIFSFCMHKYFLQMGERKSKIRVAFEYIPEYSFSIESRTILIRSSFDYNKKIRPGLILIYSKESPKWVFSFNEILTSHPNKMSPSVARNLSNFWSQTNWKDIVSFVLISKEEVLKVLADQLQNLKHYEDFEDYICMLQKETQFARKISIRMILNPQDLFSSHSNGQTSISVAVVDYRITKI